MGKGVGDGDVAEGFRIAAQERAARGGEDDALHLAALAAAQRLMHGVVLGIDGENLAAVRARGASHDVAGGHEDFLVGDADAFAGLQRGVDRRNARRADDGGDDDVGRGHRRHRRRVADDLHVSLHPRAQRLDVRGAAHGDQLRRVALDLLREKLDVAARGEADHAQRVGESVNDGESASADRTGGAEDGDVSHGCQLPVAGCL